MWCTPATRRSNRTILTEISHHAKFTGPASSARATREARALGGAERASAMGRHVSNDRETWSRASSSRGYSTTAGSGYRPLEGNENTFYSGLAQPAASDRRSTP